jgi:Trp operon repressor
MLQFRNINATPHDPVAMWGTEGILTALERGTLHHWRRVAEAAVADPHIAEELEEALELCSRAAAVDWVHARLRMLRSTDEQRVAHRLRLLILQSGLTQTEFAKRVGTSHSRLSTYLSAKVSPNATMLIRAEDVVRGL